MPISKKKQFFFFSFFSFVLILAGFLFYLSRQLDQIKAPLVSFLKSQIQGDIQISEASASLFDAAVHLKGVKLFAPNEAKPSAEIEEVVLHCSSFSLFRRNIDIRIDVEKPVLSMSIGPDGKNNFQKIFEPLLLDKPKKTSQIGQWKRINVSKLVIRDAHFLSYGEKDQNLTEIQKLNVEAEQIGFNSLQEPADLKISFQLPSLSLEPIHMDLTLKLDPAEQILYVDKGMISFGPLKVNSGGKLFFPNRERKNVELALDFSAHDINLEKFAKIFVKAFPVAGDLSFNGKLSGPIFNPLAQVKLDSKKINLNQKMEIANLHADLEKKEKIVVGNVVAGPIPLPQTNLKEKSKITEILADNIIPQKMINLDLLSNSANIIGNQLDQVSASVSLSPTNLSFTPFHFSNSKISGSGSGSIIDQKMIRISGVTTLSSGVTALLFPDDNFRSSLTEHQETLSVPFSVSGPIESPQVSIDQGYIRKMIAHAAAATFKNILFGAKKPIDLLSSAFKKPSSEPPSSDRSQQKSSSPPQFFKKLFGK